jgi:hypothetical protein
MPLGMKYDADPYDDDVDADFYAYECGWTEYAPIGEEDKIPNTCVCGADLR